MTSQYNNDRAYSNSWLVYINGLQVPAAGASVTHGVWQIPEAQIQLVPDNTALRIGAEDRVQVQIFYCDQWYRSPPEFCLAFDGEIVAWGFVSTTGARSISYACVDYIQILTQLFFFFMGSFDDIAVGVSGQQIGVGGTTVDLAGYGALYPYSLFSQGLADPGDSTANNAVISRPIDFAYNIVRSMIKAQNPNRTVPAANFFAPWCKRTNFHKRWIALPFLDQDPAGNTHVGVFPILRAVQSQQALSAVARMAASNGTAGSMWDMLADILKTMMMEVAMIPSPAAVKSDFVTLLPKGPTERELGAKFLTNYFVKPQLFFGLPPACNVFFPPQINAYSYNENYITQPTRMYFNEEAILSFLNNNSSQQTGALQGLAQDALTTGFPEEVDTAMRAVAQGASSNGKNLLVYPEEFFKGPVIDRRTMPRWFVFLQEAGQTTPDSANGGGDTSSSDDSTAADGTENSVQSPGADYEIRDIEARADLFGASDAVLDVRDASFTQAFRGVQLPAWGQIVDGSTRDRLRNTQPRPVGTVEPPAAFPIIPASAGRIAGNGSAGSFFASRANRGTGSPRLHAGIDIFGARGAQVVSATGGRVIQVTTYNGAAGTRRTDDAQGNSVWIKDTAGGRHRYMHLDTIAAGIAVGATVQPGMLIGTMGNSGDGAGRARFPVHLHYDVTSSGGYRLNFTSKLRDLREGRQATTTTTRQQPTTTPPEPEPSSTRALQNPLTSEANAGDTTRRLFNLYAAYEYYKERYSRRQGSVSMAFNPYPVAGFPCAVFDRRTTAVDTIGYVMSVRHSFSPQGWSTDVAFSHGRTLQEMFDLMRRTAALEASRLSLRQAELLGAVVARAAAGPGDSEARTTAEATLARIGTPVGRIATAPAEPLEEVRNVIQDFETADEFYKAVFYQGHAPGADAISAEQQARLQNQAEGLQVSVETARDIEARGAAALADAAQPTRVTGLTSTTSASFLPLEKRAVFYYPEIIELASATGERMGITVEGTNSRTRSEMLRVIDKIRAGTATEEELQFFTAATTYTVDQPTAGQQPSEQLTSLLNSLELQQRAQPATTNVRGDMTIVPRPAAAPLFSSYPAAMQYNGRPVCTLDEYVDFLGDDGIREGAVTPSVTSANRDPQIHPAHFYTRIRRFRPGPPEARPSSNTTATDTVTDVATGAGTDNAPAPGGTASGNALADLITQLSPDAQDAASEALAELAASGALSTITATDIPTLEAQLAQAQFNRAISPDTYNRLRGALEQASRQLGGRQPAGTTTGAAPENTPTTEAATPEQPAGTYLVEGVPLNFPDTRADWDAVLEQYRARTLTRKAPLS